MRIVLDTNVVLDLVVFNEPSASGLRTAIEAGQIALVTSGECIGELRRVLAYPKFALDLPAREAACRWVETTSSLYPEPPACLALPRCSDRDDQKFLDLAWAAGADYLVTKDKALLDLATRVSRLGRFLVSSPTELSLPTR